MACNCIIPAEFADLAHFVSSAVPVVYTELTNIINTAGILTRDGGVPDTNDAFAYSSQYVEGEGCGYWELRHFFDDPADNNLIVYVLEDEFANLNHFGWVFQNGIQPYRRSGFQGVTQEFPLYYGPQGQPDEGQLGFSVGVRFAIYYVNGEVFLYENQQWSHDTEDFTEPASYHYTGLQTDRRWRLKVYVFPSALGAHSSQVIESIMPPDSASCSESASPSASASPSSSASASPEAPCTPPEGSAISCVNARGRLFVTLANQDNSQIAYAWHEGAERMPISSMTNWKRSLRPLTLQELNVAFETDNADGLNPLVVSVHRNLRNPYVRDARTAAGSSRIDSAAANFDSDNIGDMVGVFGQNIGGEGVHFLIGRIAALASPSASPSPSSSFSSSPSTTESASPSATGSSSPSSSRSGSPSPSHSPSSSPSASPSRSRSSSLSSSGSASPSTSPSSSQSASPSAS